MRDAHDKELNLFPSDILSVLGVKRSDNGID